MVAAIAQFYLEDLIEAEATGKTTFPVRRV
jgi:hypothetical protein